MLFNAAALLALTSVVSGAALPKRAAALTDADILQYALTLEHLENAFYKQALSTMPESAFTSANFSSFFYDQLKYIAHDEEGHVLYLEAGLTAAGATPNAACTYSFPMATPQEFIAMASVVEGLGVSAYLGAAADITTKAYLTAAGAILVTESLHQAAHRNALGEIPMANVFGTPMAPNAVYSIASTFITSCPSSNAPLPVMAYPTLTLKSGLPTAPGADVDLVPQSAPPSSYYVTFVSGLDIIPVMPASFADGMIMAAVPMNISGQSYAFVTSDNSGVINDTTVLFGPAIIEVTPPSPTFDLSIQ
ncbi:MAG: hypothetical protein M1818_001707 [Claussenomyces sp. TS43310]|nr:MAG: hypothetical protein M1818_001707 [Claussenomyces sp. TS43310]